MEIRHKPHLNLFRMYDDTGKIMGEIAYVPAPDGTLAATHTEVFPEYAGQGLAAKLLDTLVEYARSQQVQVKPVCSYVVAAFAKEPEKYRDVYSVAGI